MEKIACNHGTKNAWYGIVKCSLHMELAPAFHDCQQQSYIVCTQVSMYQSDCPISLVHTYLTVTLKTSYGNFKCISQAEFNYLMIQIIVHILLISKWSLVQSFPPRSVVIDFTTIRQNIIRWKRGNKIRFTNVGVMQGWTAYMSSIKWD